MLGAMSAPAAATVEPLIPARLKHKRESSDRKAAALLLIFTALAIQKTDIGDTTEQLAVARRIRAINAIRQDGDGVSTGDERRAMGGTFDAVSTACDDDPLGGSQIGGERPGDVLAIGS
ncbi:hypothetical protein MSA03_11400 [Microbacterium saccharophilum]|nr:hypothetical protein MSA03_11400 [Microbacterium saccharophilum]